ncbi:hypothetical protein [Calditerrivibrio nitroreducens]|uniref:Uncharacterized protein n=1 Tax=Calditerrivibrio nitroreducens (strain DSM 19672 / NBRC 101217 / Yu37-1) TaxID=768670 RepID=E4THQ8_CALNY|nr:hypothetical protein [Calditerrivibrio nitroreducens]ADR19919.1 hypothetical protein Calni_2025 [Calditerrivibrio nitroreducens DSM 19672]
MSNFREIFEQAKLELQVFEKNKELICKKVLPIIFIAQINDFKIDSIKLRGKNSNDNFSKDLKKFEENHKLKFIIAKSSNKIPLSVNNITNSINLISLISYNGLLKYQSLLKRLRNAFFHNNFNIKNNFIYLKDINIKNKNKPTMLGKMKLNAFEELIDILSKYIRN